MNIQKKTGIEQQISIWYYGGPRRLVAIDGRWERSLIFVQTANGDWRIPTRGPRCIEKLEKPLDINPEKILPVAGRWARRHRYNWYGCDLEIQIRCRFEGAHKAFGKFLSALNAYFPEDGGETTEIVRAAEALTQAVDRLAARAKTMRRTDDSKPGIQKRRPLRQPRHAVRRAAVCCGVGF